MSLCGAEHSLCSAGVAHSHGSTITVAAPLHTATAVPGLNLHPAVLTGQRSLPGLPPEDFSFLRGFKSGCFIMEPRVHKRMLNRLSEGVPSNSLNPIIVDGIGLQNAAIFFGISLNSSANCGARGQSTGMHQQLLVCPDVLSYILPQGVENLVRIRSMPISTFSETLHWKHP